MSSRIMVVDDEVAIRRSLEGILEDEKYEVVLVSSGAIAAGSGVLKWGRKQKSLEEKQACAAVGQIVLMDHYEKYFAKYRMLPAQVLLTENDLSDRKRYTNARNTIEVLLKKGVLPIINENDSVATAEIVFGGPMMGQGQGNLDVPILKATGGILVLSKDECKRQDIMPCIKCGKCLDACPVFLNPQLMGQLARAERYEEMVSDANLNDCMLCGCCSFVCPSNIPLSQLFVMSRTQLRRLSA